ncbi:hypothetical protein WDU94_010784 [Cyamophila willieti]
MCLMCGMSHTLALTTTSTEPITPVDVMMLLKKIAPTFEHGHQEDSHDSSSLKNVITDHYCDTNMCGMSRTLALTTTSTEPITPIDVMMLLKKIAPTFEHGHQEDSHEFLIQLIDAINKEQFIKKVLIAINTNQYHSLHNDTVVSLEVAQSLQRAMDLFFDEKTIDDYNCGHCHKKDSAPKKFSVSKPPSVLVLHLKRKLQGQMIDLYKILKIDRCKTNQKVLSNMLTIARLSPDDFAYQYFGRPGYTAVTMGEVVHMFECDLVDVKPMQISGCYSEMVVQFNNRTIYMMPRTRILMSVGTVVPCAPGVRPLFYLSGRWFSQGEAGLVESNKPTSLEIDPLNMRFDSINNLVKEGIYSIDMLKDIQSVMTIPMEDRVSSNMIVRSMALGQNLYRKVIPQVSYSVRNKPWQLWTRPMSSYGDFTTR